MKKNIELSPNIETLFGTHDENLHLLEDGLNVSIDLKSDSIEIHGSRATSAGEPWISMESDFRSMETFRPSSSKCRFSSCVPNRVSILGLSSMFFFIEPVPRPS